jgi:hypothetical protein
MIPHHLTIPLTWFRAVYVCILTITVSVVSVATMSVISVAAVSVVSATAVSAISAVVNSVLLPSKALNGLPGCCTRLFSCSRILD